MPIFKIAKPGGSVTDAEKNLVFTSNRPCIIEIQSGTQAVSTTAEITHNLGYVPGFVAFNRVPVATFPDDIPNNSWTPCIGRFQNYPDGASIQADTSKIYLETYEQYDYDDEEYYKVPTDIFYSIWANSVTNATGTGNNNVSGKMKIAKTGQSVAGTDARQYVFFSGKSVYKQNIALSGTKSVYINSEFAIGEITHNLGYVPIVFATDLESGSRIPYALNFLTITYYITTTKVYFVIWNLGDTIDGTFDFKYKILMDKIA